MARTEKNKTENDFKVQARTINSIITHPDTNIIESFYLF